MRFLAPLASDIPRRWAWCALALLLGVLAPARARAAEGHLRTAAALPLTVTMVSDTALTLDSNQPANGPHAMYVAFRITNTSGLAVSNLSATISGFASGITLGGGQGATQYVGAIAAGASRTVYWFVQYPSTYQLRNVLTVTVSDGTGNTASGGGAARTVSMISAQAGGIANTSTIGAGAVVGQLIPLDVTFRFKGWGAGDTFNLQPAGNDTFAAGCFQLVSTVITAADPGLAAVIAPGTTDQQYFRATVSSPGGGSSWDVSIRYTFKYLCSGVTTGPLPYSNALSGGQLKYSSGYGTGGGNPGSIPPAPSPSASFSLAKAVSSTQLATGGTVTYTVTVQNVSTFATTIDSIVDSLPAGATYTGVTAASQVTAANSGAVPASGASGVIVFRGNPGTTYAVAAGATLSLVYTVTLPSAAGEYRNSAGAYVGATQLGLASTTVTVGTADVTVTKTGPATVVAGDTARYVITTANAGPQTAYRVTVRDSLPAGMTYLSASRAGTYASGVVTWPTLASLAAGTSRVDTVTVLAPATLGAVVNVARSTANSYDPTAANNDGSATTSRAATTVATPVSVTPDGLGAPLQRLAGTQYAQVFTVQNLGPVSATYALVASWTGTPAFLTIDSITGSAVARTARADSAQVTMTARATGSYTVWYTVAAGDTAMNVELLRARNVATAAWTDTGYVQLRRVFPALTIAKSVTPNTGIRPGIDLAYTVQFANAGEYAASSVVVTDQVPTQVMFKLGSLTQSLPAGLGTMVAYSRDGGISWDYTPVSGACGAPAGYDACVNQLRWTITGGTLAPAAASSVGFLARVR